jgi:cell division septation protein DedD
MRDGGWKLQLGAFGDPGNARRLGAQMGGRFPGRQISYVKSGKLTRVLVGPFASSGEASGACRGVSPCVPVRN